MTCTPWLSPADVCSPAGEATGSPAQIANAIESATSWLYRSTCYHFPGVCTSEVRLALPCGCDVPCDHRGRWRRLDLSPWVLGPVRSITAVTVNGTVLENTDGADFRLSMARYLVPHEGGGLWPWPAQHLNRVLGADGTWSVTVTHGRTPPPDLLDAAADLAKELLLKCTTGKCRIPETATSMTKDGLTLEFQLPERGQTGIPYVDSIVAMYPCRAGRRMFDPAMAEGESARVPTT